MGDFVGHRTAVDRVRMANDRAANRIRFARRFEQCLEVANRPVDDE